MSIHKVWSVGAVALLLALAQLPVACTGPSVNETSDPNVEEERPTPQRASASQVIAESSSYYGDTLTVSGEVSEIITSRAFEMGGETNEAGGSTRYGEGADGLLGVEHHEQVSPRTSRRDRPSR